MKKETRKCVQCGKKFTPPKSHIKCCSPECSKAHKRELDRARSKKEKNEVKAEKKVKKASKVVAKEVVELPPKPAVKVKVVKVAKQKEVLVHEGDFVRFVNFTPERIMKFGMRLVKMALDHIHERENKEECKCKKTNKKPCKCAKKVAKKK